MEERRPVLLEILQELTGDDLRAFRFHADPRVPKGLLHDAKTREELADLLAQRFADRCGHEVIEILKKIPRQDLVKKYRHRFSPPEDSD